MRTAVFVRIVFAAALATTVAAGGQAPADEAPIARSADTDAAASTRSAEPPAPVSIWDGVYTEAQAERGEAVYTGPCSRCHGYRLDGAPDDPDMLPSPPVAGAKFLRNWEGRSLAALFVYTRATMPENNPSYLSDDEYADVIAYMLAASGTPPGDEALGADLDRLATLLIAREPK